MYIKKLSITGYRCFSELFEINFRKGLNVIVGENGAGKTAIINSFRQLFIDTESGSYNVSSDDFNKPFKEASIAADSFKIKVEFDNLENAEPIAFLQWSDAVNNVILNLEVLNKELRGRFKKVSGVETLKHHNLMLNYLTKSIVFIYLHYVMRNQS